MSICPMNHFPTALCITLTAVGAAAVCQSPRFSQQTAPSAAAAGPASIDQLPANPIASLSGPDPFTIILEGVIIALVILGLLGLVAFIVRRILNGKRPPGA